MHSLSSKPFSSQAICQSLINARLISPDQARDLIRREGQIRENIPIKASKKKMTPAESSVFLFL